MSLWTSEIYTGAAATAIAFVLMVSAQRSVAPPRVALLLLLEPVGAAVLGVLSGEPLGWAGALGAVVIFGAIALSERVREPHQGSASAVGAA
jgi:drug/metabolite transporter (DMT)-like permease